MQKQEDFQNRALAHLLTGLGVPSDFEQRAGPRRIDVVANVDGLRVVLEAETGFHRKAQAIRDAGACLRQKLVPVVFAVQGAAPMVIGLRPVAERPWRYHQELITCAHEPDKELLYGDGRASRRHGVSWTGATPSSACSI